jgi:integrase/recombinase XerD
MSVTLRKRKNSDGTTTLYLDIYADGKREYKFLPHLKLNKPSNAIIADENREKLRLAKEVALNHAVNITASDYNIATEIGKKTLVTVWMDSFLKTYKKKDARNVAGAIKDFKLFLKQEKKQDLTFGDIKDELLFEDFQDYLIETHEGEGAASYFARFKKMMKRAHKEKLMIDNHASKVSTKAGKAKKRDTLDKEEIQALRKTSVENKQIKNAAIFTLNTGLAWVDITTLQWHHIDLKNKVLVKPREKTKIDSVVPLNNTAMDILKDQKPGEPEEYVFTLPTANGANKTLKSWVKRSGSKKKITWHNLRHSFGTNLARAETDVVSITALMGQASYKYTMRYVNSAKKLLKKATDSLDT